LFEKTECIAAVVEVVVVDVVVALEVAISASILNSNNKEAVITGIAEMVVDILHQMLTMVMEGMEEEDHLTLFLSNIRTRQAGSKHLSDNSHGLFYFSNIHSKIFIFLCSIPFCSF
jgi:hypothetical protein